MIKIFIPFFLALPVFGHPILSYPFPLQGAYKPKEAQKLIEEKASTLEARLKKKIFGQDRAIKETASAIVRYAAGINDPRSVVASLLFSGPSGVGKTELAKQLSVELYGDLSHFIRINMSEFSEAHTISRLIGSPPGYLGYGDGGQLSNALEKNPYSIVLLDELEKAHPKVLKLFLHIFDEGIFTSSTGTVIDCRSAIFICTSNILASEIADLHCKGFTCTEIADVLRPYFITHLSPELFNRLTFIVFSPLNEEAAIAVIDRLLVELRDRVKMSKGISLIFDPSLINFFAQSGVDPELGARPLKRMIDRELSTLLAVAILEGNFVRGDVLKCSYSHAAVHVEWVTRFEKE